MAQTTEYEYFVIIDDEVNGPYTANQLVGLSTTTQSSLVWRVGLDGYVVITSLPEFKAVDFPSASVPPAASTATEDVDTTTAAGTTTAVGATTTTVEGSTTYTADITAVGGTTTSTKDLTYNGGIWLSQKGITQNHITSGFAVTTDSLNLTVGTGTAYVGGRRVTTTGSTVLALTNSSSQDVYLLQDGTVEVVSDGASASSSEALKIYDTTAAGGAITATTISTVVAPISESLLGDAAVTASKLGTSAVTEVKINPGAVTEAKLATVDGLVAGSYTTPDLTVNSKGLVTSLVNRNLSTNDLSNWADNTTSVDSYAFYDTLSNRWQQRSELAVANSFKANYYYGAKVKYKTIDFADFVAKAEEDANTTLTSILELPKGSVIQTIKVKHSQAFALSTGTLGTPNVKVQYTGAVDLTSNWDVSATVASTTHQVTTDFTTAATMPHDIDIVIDLNLVIGGGGYTVNLNAGSLQIWVVYFGLHEGDGYS